MEKFNRGGLPLVHGFHSGYHIVKNEFGQPYGLEFGIKVPLAVQEVQHIFVSPIFGSIAYYLGS